MRAYRARAIPPGSRATGAGCSPRRARARPCSASTRSVAEWQALMDPATEAARRALEAGLVAGGDRAPHRTAPRCIPSAAIWRPCRAPRAVDFTPLLRRRRGRRAQVGGVPLERGAELEPHACALCGAAAGAGIAARRRRSRRCSGLRRLHPRRSARGLPGPCDSRLPARGARRARALRGR